MEKWKQRYKLALEKGRDDLANAAKFQVERFLVLSESVKSAIDQQEPYIESLEQQLLSIERHISLKPSNLEKSSIETSSKIDLDVLEARLIDLDDLSEDVSHISAVDNTSDVNELYLCLPGTPDKGTKSISKIDELDSLEAKLFALESSEALNPVDELAKLKAELADKAIGKESLTIVASEEDLLLSKKYLLFELSVVISDIEKAISNVPNHREYLQAQYKLAWERVNRYHDEAKSALQRDSDIETIEALITKQVHKKLALVLKKQLEQQSLRLDVIKRILARLNVLEKTLRIL